jgi:hypothetical protein
VEWIQSELAVAANPYSTFSQQVWAGIISHTQDIQLQQAYQGTHLARLHDALAFQSEANLARQQHLQRFEGDVTAWAAQQNTSTQ